MSTLKGPNVIRRPVGRPKRNFNITGWEEIHAVLGDLLGLCRFRGSEGEYVRLTYEGHASELKRFSLKIINLIEQIEETKKESI